MLRIADHFSGAGGSSTGALGVDDVEVVSAANHSKIAVSTYSANYPGVRVSLADIPSMDPAGEPKADVLITTPECFPAGTLVLTALGLIPIENVTVGTPVLTHQGRWRPVTDVHTGRGETVVVKGQGHPGLRVTPNHPFYVSEVRTCWENESRNYRRDRLMADWVRADQLRPLATREGVPFQEGHMWATPTRIDPLPIPRMGGGRGLDVDERLCWIIGRWLGDGVVRLPVRGSGRRAKYVRRRAAPAHCLRAGCSQPARLDAKYPHLATAYCSTSCSSQAKRGRKRGGEVMIVCGHHEVDGLQAELDARGGAPPGARAADELRWRRRDQRTAAVFSTGHSYFGRGRPSAYTEWLVTNFGRHAHAKRLPAWVFGMPEAWRAALLEGYLSADGHTGVRTQGAKTVSKELAFGVRLLAEGLGHRVGITVRSRR